MTSSSRAGAVVRSYRYVPTQATVSELQGGVEAAQSPDGGDGRNWAAEAAALLTEAQRQAEALTEHSRAEAERLRRTSQEEGRRAGYEAGVQAGREAARAEAASRLARWDELLAALIRERARLLREAEGDVAGLALAISQKVIGDLAGSCSALILHLAQRGADLLGNPATYEVHVSPEDHDGVAAALEEHPLPRRWTLVADPRIAPGGCTVHHGAAQVDASPEVQFAALQAAFAEMTEEMRLGSADGTDGRDAEERVA